MSDGKVLIVDADRDRRAFLSAALQSAGFDVVVGVDTEDVSVLCADEAPDVLVFALSAPEPVELPSHLPKALFVVDEAHPLATAQDAQRLGAEDIIKSPVNAYRFVARVRALVRLSDPILEAQISEVEHAAVEAANLAREEAYDLHDRRWQQARQEEQADERRSISRQDTEITPSPIAPRTLAPRALTERLVWLAEVLAEGWSGRVLSPSGYVMQAHGGRLTHDLDSDHFLELLTDLGVETALWAPSASVVQRARALIDSNTVSRSKVEAVLERSLERGLSDLLTTEGRARSEPDSESDALHTGADVEPLVVELIVRHYPERHIREAVETHRPRLHSGDLPAFSSAEARFMRLLDGTSTIDDAARFAGLELPRALATVLTRQAFSRDRAPVGAALAGLWSAVQGADYFDVLGVPKTASDVQIRQAYAKRRAAVDAEPDDAPFKSELLRALEEALSVLSVDALRESYRRNLPNAGERGRIRLPPAKAGF